MADNEVRSLLQKAVRRGQVEMVNQVVDYLIESGDSAWLKHRTAVIAAEECWTFCAQDKNPRILLPVLAARQKNREAAGLGGLAYRFMEGDKEADYGEDVRDVADAISDPSRLLQRMERTDRSFLQAMTPFFRGGLPWDRAFMIAAFYLRLQGVLPEIGEAAPLDLPTWVSLDKHTASGAEALREVCRQKKVNYDTVGTCFFLVHGGRCNATVLSSWWDRKVSHTLRRLGMDKAEVIRLVRSLEPDLIERLAPAGQALMERLIPRQTSFL